MGSRVQRHYVPFKGSSQSIAEIPTGSVGRFKSKLRRD
jgi:hypothetical protein